MKNIKCVVSMALLLAIFLNQFTLYLLCLKLFFVTHKESLIRIKPITSLLLFSLQNSNQ